MKKIIPAGLLLLAMLGIWSCQSGPPPFEKKPIDNIIRDLASLENYSILLYDMDFDQEKEHYLHKYRVLKEPAGQDTLIENITEWQRVPAPYFEEHVNDMGMALVTKTNGVVEKKTTPPGYNNYVGNEKYGQWKQGNNGTSFWEFYGQYAFMRSLFGFGYSPIYYGGWNNYRRNYYPYGRTYYGTSGGNTRFGTNGTHTRNRSARSTWNSRSSSFKSNVRSRVKRSASRTRSTSRFRSRSSSRSRGFGSGK